MEVNGLDWQCYLTGSSKTAPRIFAEYLFYVKFIATFALTFSGSIISVLASVKSLGSRGLGIALLSGSTSFSGSYNFRHFSFSEKFGQYLNSKVSITINMFQHDFLAIHNS